MNIKNNWTKTERYYYLLRLVNLSSIKSIRNSFLWTVSRNTLTTTGRTRTQTMSYKWFLYHSSLMCDVQSSHKILSLILSVKHYLNRKLCKMIKNQKIHRNKFYFIFADLKMVMDYKLVMDYKVYLNDWTRHL